MQALPSLQMGGAAALARSRRSSKQSLIGSMVLRVAGSRLPGALAHETKERRA